MKTLSYPLIYSTIWSFHKHLFRTDLSPVPVLVQRCGSYVSLFQTSRAGGAADTVTGGGRGFVFTPRAFTAHQAPCERVRGMEQLVYLGQNSAFPRVT